MAHRLLHANPLNYRGDDVSLSMTDSMTEQLASFGEGFSLNGIINVPDQLDNQKPAVVILNSGLMHKVGTCRISVKLARALANAGYLVTRFDLSGIGDSEAREVNLDPNDRIVEEVSTVLDSISESYGISKFVLYGLCSGAQNSFKTALQDDRVVGLAGVDNFGFRTKRYHVAHYLPKLIQPGHWVSFIVRHTKQVLSFIKGIVVNTPKTVVQDLWPYPPKEFIETGYKKLAQRGLRFLYIYTGSWVHQYNYLNQFYHMYPSVNFGDNVTLEYKPEMTHSMVEPESQSFVIATILGWLDSIDWDSPSPIPQK